MAHELSTSAGRLRWLREDRQMTQKALAAAVNVTQSAIAHFERGKVPGRVTQAAIADVLGVKRSFLWPDEAEVAA